MKDTKEGACYLGCSTYPACKAALWLPRCITNARAIEDMCPSESCLQKQIHLVEITFNKNHVPPGTTLQQVACVAGCSSFLNELLDNPNSMSAFWKAGSSRQMHNVGFQLGNQNFPNSGQKPAFAQPAPRPVIQPAPRSFQCFVRRCFAILSDKCSLVDYRDI